MGIADDLDHMVLLNKYKALSDAVIKVVSQKQDDVCWLDAYRELAKLVDVPYDPQLLPRPRFLANCQRYYDCLAEGYPYKTGEIYVSGGEGI